MERIDGGECETDLSLDELSSRFISKINSGEKIMSNGSLIAPNDLYKIKITKSEEPIDNYITIIEGKRKLSRKSVYSFLQPSSTWEAIDLCQDITNEILSTAPVEISSNLENYINPSRISTLKQIQNENFDLSRLVAYLEEVNNNYKSNNFFATAMLLRAIIDHIPPIFGQNSFPQVAGQIGSRSFKSSMNFLEKGLRKISDSYLHSHIKKKEILPVNQQIEFRAQFDILISEIINTLS